MKCATLICFEMSTTGKMIDTVVCFIKKINKKFLLNL